jgi:hypothetical protein
MHAVGQFQRRHGDHFFFFGPFLQGKGQGLDRMPHGLLKGSPPRRRFKKIRKLHQKSTFMQLHHTTGIPNLNHTSLLFTSKKHPEPISFFLQNGYNPLPTQMSINKNKNLIF